MKYYRNLDLKNMDEVVFKFQNSWVSTFCILFQRLIVSNLLYFESQIQLYSIDLRLRMAQ